MAKPTTRIAIPLATGDRIRELRDTAGYESIGHVVDDAITMLERVRSGDEVPPAPAPHLDDPDNVALTTLLAPAEGVAFTRIEWGPPITRLVAEREWGDVTVFGDGSGTARRNWFAEIRLNGREATARITERFDSFDAACSWAAVLVDTYETGPAADG